jgi:hypothetical protein
MWNKLCWLVNSDKFLEKVTDFQYIVSAVSAICGESIVKFSVV